MSYTIDIKCTQCGALICCQHIGDLDELAEGKVSFLAECSKCGFEKEYRSVLAEEAERLMQEALDLSGGS